MVYLTGIAVNNALVAAYFYFLACLFLCLLVSVGFFFFSA